MLDGCTIKRITDAKVHNSLGVHSTLGHALACGVYQVESIQLLLICFDFNFFGFDGRRYCHNRFIL